ncbi:MAG: diaminopimelate decarboxylase [Actinobacteria bacterium]|nr:diaminopimelate decarboxylase [Actinomycetota bacterium]
MPKQWEDHTMSSTVGIPADLNVLAAHVWPAGVQRSPDTGVVSMHGHDVRELAEQFGTPAYVLDEIEFRDRIRSWKSAFDEATNSTASVYYAGKAFLCSAVVRWLAQEGVNLDVCTGGELAVALRAGFDPAAILMHGNNKSQGELTQAVEAGVGLIVLDSFEEIARLAHIAAQAGKVQAVLIRVTVGVEAHTHEYIATAHEDQKFGFSLAGGQALEAIKRVNKLSALSLQGLHSHIGSQIFNTSGFEVAAHRLTQFLVQVRDECSVELPMLDLGGGLGIAYTPDDDPLAPQVIAQQLIGIVAEQCQVSGLAMPRIVVEPGRAIAGPTTMTIYQVGTIKPIDLDGITRTYVSVDGGMSDNIRTALYDAVYTCSLVSRASAAEPMLVRVVGKHCETGDIVVRDAWLPSDLAPGDLIAVAATGAYGRSMASNYNHVPRPPVVAVTPDASRLIVRRESVEDILALDVD